MSVHRVQRADGSVVWRVRWREGGRSAPARTRTFALKGDALAFEREVRRRHTLGDVGILVGSQETLDEYVAGTWAPSHAVTLAPSTAANYATVYDKHIAPFLGHRKLSELTPEAIRRWQAERIASGTGRDVLLRAMALLGGILQRALEAERISRNPGAGGAQGVSGAAARGAAVGAGDGGGAAGGERAAGCDADLGPRVCGAAAAGGDRAHLGARARSHPADPAT